MTVQSKKLEGKKQHKKTQCNVTQLKVVFFPLKEVNGCFSTYQDVVHPWLLLQHCKNRKSRSAGVSQVKQQHKNKISRSADSSGQATVQEHNRQVSRQYKPSNSTRTQPSNSTRTQSAGQQTVQAKQQYKNTDSTSQATVQEHSQSTVQEHNQQVSRQYKPSNSTRTQSAGQQTVQAKQQYKSTISRSGDLQAKQQYKNTISRSAELVN